MPAPLDDITIYYYGQKIKDTPDDWEFRRTVNYICDFYHKMLFGYKPPKTSRICIHVGEGENVGEPAFNGSICGISNVFDDDKYLSLAKKEQYKYILDIVHSACMRCAELLEWNADIFIDAFNEVRKRGFSFYLDYPLKKSKDRQKAAFVKIVKTELSSILYLNFFVGNETKTVKLFENKNWFWYDPIYELAKNSKWLDTSTFGVCSKKLGKHSYYSLIDEVIIGNILEDNMQKAS